MAEYIEVPGFEDLTPEKVKISDSIEYLNKVLGIYGPPCEWCVHFNMFCSKKCRPRERLLKFGPFESWHLKKQCKKFKEKKEKDKSETLKKYVGLSLDCGAQTYG